MEVQDELVGAEDKGLEEGNEEGFSVEVEEELVGVKNKGLEGKNEEGFSVEVEDELVGVEECKRKRMWLYSGG